MLSGMTRSAVLLAQNGGGGGGEIGQLIFMMLPIFVLFYFLFIRPQRKEQSERQAMLANMKKNDRIVTVGGIMGVVTNVDREKKEVTIKVDEGSGAKLRMTLGSINRIVTDDASKQSSS